VSERNSTIRVDRRTNVAAGLLARMKGVTKKEIIARAVEALRRREVLDAANAGYALMRREGNSSDDD
jgi:hypothetical protein